MCNDEMYLFERIEQQKTVNNLNLDLLTNVYVLHSFPVYCGLLQRLTY